MKYYIGLFLIVFSIQSEIAFLEAGQASEVFIPLMEN